MIIPVYQKIKITHIQEEILLETLDEIQFHKSPIVYIFENDKNFHNRFLNYIEDYYYDNEIFSKIPYPTYIISSEGLKSEVFNCLKSVQDLPKYYNISRKQPNSYETELINKINIQSERIVNNLKMKNYKNNNVRDLQKEIYLLTREAMFYESIKEIMDQHE